jgi:hypothetical protein
MVRSPYLLIDVKGTFVLRDTVPFTIITYSFMYQDLDARVIPSTQILLSNIVPISSLSTKSFLVAYKKSREFRDFPFISDLIQ